MFKHAFFFWLLSLVLITSCAHEVIDDHDYEASDSMKELPDITQRLKLALNQGEGSLRATSTSMEGDTLLSLDLLKVRWDDAQYYLRADSMRLVHVPFYSSWHVRLLNSQMDEITASQMEGISLTRTTLVRVEHLARTQEGKNYLMHLAPSVRYLENGGRLRGNELLPKNYDGDVLFFDLAQNFVGQLRYVDGVPVDLPRAYFEICFNQEVHAYAGTDTYQEYKGVRYKKVCTTYRTIDFLGPNIGDRGGHHGGSDGGNFGYSIDDLWSNSSGGGGGAPDKLPKKWIPVKLYNFNIKFRRMLSPEVSTNMPNELQKSLDSVSQLLYTNDAYKPYTKMLNELGRMGRISKIVFYESEDGSYGASMHPTLHELRFKGVESINEESLLHELIHFAQYRKRTYQKRMIGMVEYENQLIRHIVRYVHYKNRQNFESYMKSKSISPWFSNLDGNPEFKKLYEGYVDWIHELTDGGRRYPSGGMITLDKFMLYARFFPLYKTSYAHYFGDGHQIPGDFDLKALDYILGLLTHPVE